VGQRHASRYIDCTVDGDKAVKLPNPTYYLP